MAKTSTPPATVQEARASLDSLRELHAKLEARRAEIGHERERLAGAALIDGSTRASRKLSELGKEEAASIISAADISAAIRTAESRLKAATDRDAHEREIEKAQQARALLAERLALAEQAQQALATFGDLMSRLVLAGRELRRLSDRAASDRHDGLCLRTAMQLSRCDLHRRGLLSSEALPDESMRLPLQGLIAHIDQAAARWTNTIIDSDVTQPEEIAA